jgi:hypothetical protein
VNLVELHRQMLQAAQKCEAASERYRRREAELEARAAAEFTRNGVTDPRVQQIRMDAEKSSDHWLNKAFNKYNFWQGEQIRLSQLLMAHIQFLEYKRHIDSRVEVP